MQIKVKSSTLNHNIIQKAKPYCTKCTSCNHIHKKCSTYNKNITHSTRKSLCDAKPPKNNIRNFLEQYKVYFNPVHQDKDSPIANSIVENTTDQFNDLRSNFNYYDIHEFYKLKHNKIPKSSISLIHTNIGSLQANIEKLEILSNHLAFKFDVIS